MVTYIPADYPRDAPPRFRIYGIGVGKTGTHSLAAIFGGRYRSAHEPNWGKVIRHCLDLEASRRGDFFFSPQLASLVAQWPWEMNASTLNYHLLALLLQTYPDARYVQTVREPVSWLASITRHETNAPRHRYPLWWEVRRLRFRPDLYPHSDLDMSLRGFGLFSVEGYLRYWRRHQANCLAEVPADRLAVIDVGDLDKPAAVARLAAFAGVPVETLQAEQGRQFVSDTPFDLFRHVDRTHVERLAEEICGDVWRELGRRAAAG